MTPPRGVVRLAIQAALAGLMVGLAVVGGVGRRRTGPVRYRCPRCFHECDRRVLP